MSIFIKFIAERFIKKIAKKAKAALLQIPFYRKKLKKNGISFYEVRRINSIERLTAFLNKYKEVTWISEHELLLMSDTYGLQLSRVPQQERVWVQASSGYNLSKIIENGNFRVITRKRIAYTKGDLLRACKLFEMLSDIFPKQTPTIAIFGRLGDLCGSGTYPFLVLSGNYLKFKCRTLYFGIPQNEVQALQWLKEISDLKIDGIIGIPSTLDLLTKIAKEHGLFFEKLKLVGSGGDKIHKGVINSLIELGANIITVGYGAQEVAPLSTVAIGVPYSELKELPATQGLRVLGNLCFVRITDKRGESVDQGEEGYIRITTPFDGTTLIDYNINDIGRLISHEYSIYYKGKSVNVPFPLLDYRISRAQEHAFSVQARIVYTRDLQEVCNLVAGYNYLLGSDNERLYIFITTNHDPEFLLVRLKHALPHEIFKNVEVIQVPEHILHRYLYPANHYKPHNILDQKQLTDILRKICK